MRLAITIEKQQPRRAGRRQRVGVVAVVVSAVVSVWSSPVFAQSAQVSPGTSGSAVGTVSVEAPAIRSITVSPGSFSYATCSGGSSTPTQLGFPNGKCTAVAVTVTNTGNVAGMLAVKADNLSDSSGHSWTNACTSLSCTVVPGAHQFRVDLAGGAPCTTGPVCESGLSNPAAVPPTSSNTVQLLPSNALPQVLTLTGPSANDGTATSYHHNVTWTIS